MKAYFVFKITVLCLLCAVVSAPRIVANEIDVHDSLKQRQQQSIGEDIVGPNPIRQDINGLLLRPAVNGEIRVLIILPPAHHLLEGFAARYLVKKYADAPLVIAHDRSAGTISDTRFYIPFITGAQGKGTLEVQAVYGYCNDKDKLCIPRDVVWRIHFALDSQQGIAMIELEDKP